MTARAAMTKAPIWAAGAAPAAALPQRRSEADFAPPIASLSAVPAQPSLQRKCAGCEAGEKEELAVQPRLEVGPAGDRFEREADAIAGQVMAMRDADANSAAPAVQRACSACSASNEAPEMRRSPAEAGMEEEEDEAPVRARRASAAAESETIAASHGALTSGGSALPAATRGFFEARMSRDLSGVRVHQGGSSAALNRSIAARAFTYRDHIWLGSGEGAGPSFTMAHELAHVMQQTAPGPVGPGVAARREASPAPASAQRAAPVAAAAAAPAAGLTVTAAIGKCIVGAVIGVFFDVAVQALLHAIREGTLRVWEATMNRCSLLISAAVGCVAGPISATVAEPAIVARVPAIASRQGTILGWLLLKAAAATGMFLPQAVVKGLLKLGCINAGEAGQLGGTGGGDDPVPTSDIPTTPTPAPPGGGSRPALDAPAAAECEKRSGDASGNERILMKVNTADLLNADERTRLDIFADGIRPTKQKVAVHGMASTDGPTQFNEQLSCTRAIVGRNSLLSRGIESTRIAGVYQHGEVEGAKEWQRGVVYELVGAAPGEPPPPSREPPTAPEPAPPSREPPAGPVPAPPSTDPTLPPETPQPGVAPQLNLRNVSFTSDHGKLQQNDKNWNVAGKVVKPEWTDGNTDGLAAPISHSKALPLLAEAEVDIEPLSAPAGPVTLFGEASTPALNMRGTANLGGGKGQKIMLRGTSPLPDMLSRLYGQNIYWVSQFDRTKRLVATSTNHEVLITYDQPRKGLTTKRARTAIELTEGAGNNPHKIMGHQVASYGFYNLKNPIKGDPWQFADVIPPGGPGSDCQSIIRFMIAVNDAIGLPGEAKGLAVYADPKDAATPKTAPLIEAGGASGGMFSFDDPANSTGYALIDGAGYPNNYEATLEYKLSGSEFFPDLNLFQRYYPGGIPGAVEGKTSLLDVLHVFTKLSRLKWVSAGGSRVRQVEDLFCYTSQAKCDAVEVKDP